MLLLDDDKMLIYLLCALIVINVILGAILSIRIANLGGPDEIQLNVNHRIDPPDEFQGIKINDFMIVSQRYAETHTYDINEFNCVNYSAGIKMIADELDLPVRIIQGCPYNVTKNNTCHQWVQFLLDVEPQNAYSPNYDDKYPIQKVIIDFDEKIKDFDKND